MFYKNYVTVYRWHVTHDMWHVTCDTWHVTHDTWHVTRDTLHVTCEMLEGMNILSKFQLPSSYCLWFMILWRFWGKGALTDLINQLITSLFVEQPRLHPGLHKIYFFLYPNIFQGKLSYRARKLKYLKCVKSTYITCILCVITKQKNCTS